MVKRTFTRRTNAVGTPMMVKLPTDGWESTNEGGMAFFLVVSHKEPKRSACICGTPGFITGCEIGESQKYSEAREFTPVDAALLIGSTGQSLWNGNEYFHATYTDLTEEGQHLYDILVSLYGDIDIITDLDT